MADGGRSITVVSGIYTLIQGLLWSLVSIYYIAINDCILTNPLTEYAHVERNVNVYTLLYASYFNGSSCNGGPQFRGLLETPPSNRRTYYWMTGYAILSSVWIPVSVLLIVSGVCKVKGVCGTYFYVPWILVSIATTIADVVAVIFYSVDIYNTMSADDYVKFLGASGTWKEVTGVDKIGQDPAAPAVIMTLFFSRFIVFWLLNLSLIFHCIKEAHNIEKSNLQNSLSTEDIMDDEKFRTWNRPNLNRPLNFKGAKKVEDTDSASSNINERHRKTGAPEVNICENKNVVHENNMLHNSHLEESKTNPKILYKVDEFGIPIEEIRIPRLSNSYEESSGSDIAISPPVFDYLGRPTQLQSSRSRVENTNGSEQGRRRVLSSSQELLRSQTPWSYLNPAPSRKPNTPESPPIPSPDYMDQPRNDQMFSYTHGKPKIIKKQPSTRRVHGLQ